ncbi:MAG: 16S rRNA (adenine(1518)-N(6)/adenine(1519)-N(6))-dimethyltransferase RsmA [Oscillospiraceae bacterium]|nr:16S rRNA (adenine(1518)-N(6)/adenine(1519)-N(6))-dimethyltransferase RsmA [Oscillospiraceae bacterium]
MNLTNIKTIKALLQKHGFSFSRSLGQNFLINPSVCPKIARLGGVGETNENVGVLEIGAGVGVLTRELALRYKKVVVVEIDKTLAPVLEETLAEFLDTNTKIIYGDILELDLKELLESHFKGMDVVCCANLPYYITTPVIMRLLEIEALPEAQVQPARELLQTEQTCSRFETGGSPAIRAVTVMVQSEVATRLVALPGTRECGAISAAVRYYGEAERLFDVSARSFFPAPKVDSTVIKITITGKHNLDEVHKKRFFKVVKSVFSQRRKQIINPLSSDFDIPKEKLRELLLQCGINPASRAENLKLENFLDIGSCICSY